MHPSTEPVRLKIPIKIPASWNLSRFAKGNAMTTLTDYLTTALGPDRQHTAIVIRANYQPAGGTDRTVMPPTYPLPDGLRPRQDGTRDVNAAYLIGHRLVDGEKRDTVVIDQEPSQANRVEEALREARDTGTLQLPIFELRTSVRGEEIRLTSLDFPHRYADAYIRDSLVNGVRFDQSSIGSRIRSATVMDVRPLYEREPCSLLFGAWDSIRKGRWPKFARLYSATMYGLDPVTGVRQGGKMDLLNLTGGIDDKTKAESDWKYLPEGTKAKGQKLSEIGYGNIRPNPIHGGVTVSGIRRTASISLAGLERLRFGDAKPEGATLARAALAALALAGDRLAFGSPSVWLRSGCDLAKTSETIGLELPGGQIEPLDITARDALAAFHDLRDRASASGVPMGRDTIALTPIPALAEAIAFAVTSSSQDAGD
jgi:CRISPR-associated protein Csb1